MKLSELMTNAAKTSIIREGEQIYYYCDVLTSHKICGTPKAVRNACLLPNYCSSLAKLKHLNMPSKQYMRN